MKIDKRSLEGVTISTGLVTIVLMIIFASFAFADLVFEWDLFSEEIQRGLGVIMFFLGSIVIACFLLNIMVNLSIMSSKMENQTKKIS
ncbi:hypothetical protein A2713_01495 [candidate division WWE3 bacterium RIFCSPHIGHO2_01_FULL_35_17]|uniref:Uncharacterized protein n=1 Tax=candidate division WWE3 bacterium RIFCSPHIGHO2_01_FULL_35_17 TaxID=1802614 RepID=A0A1F4UP01_UNCKA|nr:MAG: hypothetical protein A2713_01495 [candidate division WWE3 bacterium RIFCSPHIGHO2_01_FULL_35_17]